VCNENKLNIIQNEMTDDMKSFVFGAASTLFNIKNDLNSIANRLSQVLNEQYGNEWYCIVGATGLASHIPETMPNTLLWFSYNSTQVILFKPKSKNSDEKSFIEMINAAKAASYPQIYSWSLPCGDVFNKSMTFAKESFDLDINTFKDCRRAWGSSIIDSCYYYLGDYVFRKLQEMFGGGWLITVGNVKQMSTYFDGYYAEKSKFNCSIFFHYADVAFNIIHN